MGHPGGLESVAEMLAKFLCHHDCRTIWAFGTAGRATTSCRVIRYRVFDLLERLLGVPSPIPTPSSGRKLFRLVKSADVVLVHDFMYLSSFLTILFCLMLKKPYVLMLHVWRVAYSGCILNWLQSVAHLLFGRLALSQAFSVFTCSREILREVEQRRPAASYFVPNGIHVREGETRSEVARHKPILASPYRRRVCFAGRCVEKKGLRIIREAATALPDVQFTIAGTGPIDPAAWHLANVRTLGWIDRDALTDLFAESDLLLLPSRGEGFPLTVQEAMASGLPCALFEETWRAWGRDRSHFHLLPDQGYLTELRGILQQPLSATRRAELASYANQNWNWEQTTKSYARALHAACPDPGTGSASARSHPAEEIESLSDACSRIA
jgi:glycosyltransferase involved in cell wall biosynthesis